MKDESQVKKTPSVIVVDHSWALITSSMIVFNQIKILKYLNWAYETFMENKLDRISEYKTKIYICAYHMLKLIIEKTKKVFGVEKKIKNALVYSFTLLQNTRNPKKFILILEHIYVIFNYKYLSTEVINSLNFLQNELISREIEFSFDYYQNENLVNKDYSKTPILDNKITEKENIKKNSPFRNYFDDLISKFKNKVHIINKEVKVNDFFCPALFEIIHKKLYIAPLWCGFIFTQLEGFECVTRLSNNPVESWFNILKNKILTSKRLMPSEYLGDLYNKISAEFLDNYIHHYNDLIVTNIRNIGNQKNQSQTENIWVDKDLKRKKKTYKKGFYEKSSIFSRALNLINFSKTNIEKTFSSGNF